MKAARYLAWFIGWSLAFALPYVLLFPYYQTTVLYFADFFADLVVQVSIKAHPMGLVVTSPDARVPMGVPYNLFSIGLNVIFAPALVMASVHPWTAGIVRSVIAVFAMMVLHGMQVFSIVMFYMAHPENTVLTVGLPGTVTALTGWLYGFVDKMSYALFPFVSWAIACPDYLKKLLRLQTEAAQKI